MPYNKGATKAMKNFKKEYGSSWKSVYFALANKRAGKGLRGKHRGHVAANSAFKKGSTWSRKGRKGSVTVKTKGKANVSHRSGGTHIRVRVK